MRSTELSHPSRVTVSVVGCACTTRTRTGLRNPPSARRYSPSRVTTSTVFVDNLRNALTVRSSRYGVTTSISHGALETTGFAADRVIGILSRIPDEPALRPHARFQLFAATPCAFESLLEDAIRLNIRCNMIASLCSASFAPYTSVIAFRFAAAWMV